ncbi:hypothetical protein [Stenotrophomonas sp.]|uniref:hypothetical protein n=1 Tax=Stenotrophomonas sp. TaxID=69392 RepID=UPI0028A1F2C7|nr:hypothetical protein [Stenotrophomonas sp.]
MDAIEKRAREVEAALREQVIHHRDLSNPLYMSAHGRLLHQAAEVIAALTPPEGYVPATAVLATATRLRRLASAASPLGRKAYIKAAEDIEMTVSAARPEVKP